MKKRGKKKNNNEEKGKDSSLYLESARLKIN
jgi:hypothetical protein